jgi:hypothetical protein
MIKLTIVSRFITRLLSQLLASADVGQCDQEKDDCQRDKE